MNEIDIYEGLPEEITQFAVIDVAAITLANSIYFAPGQYSGNLDGIELIAHELTHVKQLGAYRAKWVCISAYFRNIVRIEKLG